MHNKSSFDNYEKFDRVKLFQKDIEPLRSFRNSATFILIFMFTLSSKWARIGNSKECEEKAHRLLFELTYLLNLAKMGTWRSSIGDAFKKNKDALR